MARRRATLQNRKLLHDYEDYIICPDRWDLDYHFGIAAGRYEIEPYSEFASVRLEGRLARPIPSKYQNASVTISATIRVDKNLENPKSIGFIQAADDSLIVNVWIPGDRLVLIGLTAAQQRVAAVFLRGTKVKWRKASIWSLRVSTEFNEEDY